jgi:hypothetical protein
MSRKKVPFAELAKCDANIGKELRVTMQSGKVYEGMIWNVMYSKRVGIDPVLNIRVWGNGLLVKAKYGMRGGLVIPLRASSITKFEFLWESRPVETPMMNQVVTP